jgi:hypothetical protein
MLLVAAQLQNIPLPSNERIHVSLAALATAALYVVLVFVLFFLTSTPVESERVLGLQGRYFVPIVPIVAVAAAGLAPRPFAGPVPALAASAAAVLSALALIEAVLRIDWVD